MGAFSEDGDAFGRDTVGGEDAVSGHSPSVGDRPQMSKLRGAPTSFLRNKKQNFRLIRGVNFAIFTFLADKTSKKSCDGAGISSSLASTTKVNGDKNI
jgi:hypothetical protein